MVSCNNYRASKVISYKLKIWERLKATVSDCNSLRTYGVIQKKNIEGERKLQ